jgi:hypothetical protein
MLCVWVYMYYDLSRVASCGPPEDGNHLPKHVRVEFGMY